jgi:hypothetical protein
MLRPGKHLRNDTTARRLGASPPASRCTWPIKVVDFITRTSYCESFTVSGTGYIRDARPAAGVALHLAERGVAARRGPVQAARLRGLGLLLVAAGKLLGWPKIRKLARAFRWEYSYKRLKSPQLLANLAALSPAAPAPRASRPR